jgi:hypothetical protein
MGVVSGHLLTRLQHRIETVFDHLRLVAIDRFDDVEPAFSLSPSDE